MWHARERRGKCTGFWWESRKERDHLEERGVDGRMGSEWILGRLASGAKTITLTYHMQCGVYNIHVHSCVKIQNSPYITKILK
jgi:hypothetical protein